MLWRSNIQSKNPDRPRGFDPQNRDAQVGDAIYWVNEDQGVEHQPYPKSGTATTWCNPALPGMSQSKQVNLGVPGTIDYLCAIHPEETGTIVVATPVEIGRTADDKAAFVPSTAATSSAASVVWDNSDSQEHWPAPVGGASDEWMPSAIAPGEVSPLVAFPDAGTFPYRCAVAGHTETGTVVASHQITINSGSTNASFQPSDQNANAGDPIWWFNNDTQSHQPTPDSGAAWFKNPIGANAFSSSITIATAGSVPYHCALHPGETGTITVG